MVPQRRVLLVLVVAFPLVRAQGSGFVPGLGAHQFDNVSILFIPAPATLWLFVVGIVVLMLTSRVGRRPAGP